MIEILKPTDVGQVHDEKLKAYLTYSFNRLPDDYLYPDYGYFVIIESQIELEAEPIHLTHSTISSLFEYIEMVEEKNGVIEIVQVLDSDFGVSLIMKREIVTDALYQRLQEYKVTTP